MSASNTLLNNKKFLVIRGSSRIGRGVAAAALADGASVVIASSKQTKVEAAVELCKTGIDANTNMTVSGEAFDIRDFKPLAELLKKQAPFDHLVRKNSLFNLVALTNESETVRDGACVT